MFLVLTSECRTLTVSSLFCRWAQRVCRNVRGLRPRAVGDCSGMHNHIRMVCPAPSDRGKETQNKKTRSNNLNDVSAILKITYFACCFEKCQQLLPSINTPWEYSSPQPQPRPPPPLAAAAAAAAAAASLIHGGRASGRLSRGSGNLGLFKGWGGGN